MRLRRSGRAARAFHCPQTALPYDVLGLLQRTLEPYQGSFQLFWYNQTDGSYNNCYMVSGDSSGGGVLLPPQFVCYNRDEPLTLALSSWPQFDPRLKKGWLAA